LRKDISLKCIAFIIFVSTFFILTGCRGPSASEDLLYSLPSEADLPGWIPQGKAQTATGDDLYLLINGGAETYLEYGFRRAVIQSYETADGHMFNLEIYEMEDGEAARKIYTFKTDSTGKVLYLGDESRLESYYLNVRQGRHIVTAIGLDASGTTKQALTEAARITVSRIAESQKPETFDP